MGGKLGPSEPAGGCLSSLAGLLSELCRDHTVQGWGWAQPGGAATSPLGPRCPSLGHRRERAGLMLCGLFLAATFYGALPHPAKPPQASWDGSTTVPQCYFPLSPVWGSRGQESPPRKAFPQLGRRISGKGTGPKIPSWTPLPSSSLQPAPRNIFRRSIPL